MNPFYAFNRFRFLKIGIQITLFAFLVLSPKILSACDQSGYYNVTLADNGDGTFTITMTIQAAGGGVPNLGSTWGFYWEVDADIVSIDPIDITSSNGTTLSAVIAGNTISWGDPNPGPSIPFVDVAAGGPSETFDVTIVVSSLPSEWMGGGQEGNNCPGGAGTSPPNYEGEFPCLPPFIVAVQPPPACAGDLVTMTVIPSPAYLVDEIVWEPGGLTGTSVDIVASETTEYTVTASNSCEEFSLTITLDVTPLPTIEPIEPNMEACEGFPLIMEVFPMNELLVEWEPGGMVGNVLIEVADPNVTVYTATASNQCGEETTEINVNVIPPPSIEIVNSNEVICAGDTVELESEPMYVDLIEWLPGGLNGQDVFVSPDSTQEYTVVGSSNCGVDLDTVLVTVASADTTSIALEACEGETVSYNGIPLSAGSSSVFTFENVAGCDSVVNVAVEEITAYTTPVELTACEGTTVTYQGQQLSPGDVEEFSFVAFNGCDSIVTVTVLELEIFASDLELSTCDGSTVSYQGQQLSPGDVEDFTLTAANGCDSVVTVSVSGFPNYAEDVMLQTCTGTTISYNGQNLAPGSTTIFGLITANGCDSVVTVFVEELAVFETDVTLEACTGTTAPYNGQQLQPGSVTDFTFTTALGCDSIVTVTVNEVAIIEESVEMAACEGEMVLFNGTPVLAGTSMDFNFVTAQGCDSVVTVVVDELQTYLLPLTLEACTGESVQYNGMDLLAGTTTDVDLTTLDGCDSVMTVTVEEIVAVTGDLMLGACEGEMATYNGEDLAPGSVTDFTLVSSLGCDSILTVTVEEYPTFGYPLFLEACTGATITFDGVPLPPGTSVDFTYATVNGCDSVVSVFVDEVETIFTELEFEICDGNFISYNGQQLPPNTETDFTFTSYLGCDSIVTVVVDEAPLITATDEYDACEGTSIMYNGQALDAGSVTDITLLTPDGCDSVVTVTVNELENFASPLALEACTGSTAVYNGQQLAIGSVTDFTLTAMNGCDSVVTVTVNEVTALSGSEELEACEGTTVTYMGQQLTPGSETDFTLTASNGCDSVVTVTVNELFNQSDHVDLTACSGEMTLYNGTPLPAGSVTDFTFTSADGCDSVVTVTVEELFPQSASVQLEGCEGELVQYAGQSILAGTTADVTLTAINGCDSVVTVTVAELSSSVGSVTLEGCEGEILTYNGTQVPAGSSMDFTLVNAAGCDSVVTVTALDPISSVESFETIEVCEGDAAIIFGQAISDPGVYAETYISQDGCDSTHYITLDVVNDLAIAFQDNIEIGLGDSVVLRPQIVTNAPLIYNWQEDSTLSCIDCLNPVATPINTTTYFLTVTNDQGCHAEGDVLVLVRKRRGVYIPNSFSPNGDGINDVFMVYSDPKAVANILSFRVFSRWGEIMYEYYNFPPNDPFFGWDGKHRSEDMDPAVFAYMVEVEFVDGVTKLFKGDVTLVK